MSSVNVWTGSTWGCKPVKVWSGSAWVEKTVKAWSGSAWVEKTCAASIDPTLALDLDFTITTTLDPRITFTRASIATCYNSSGVLTTAASGAPRFDHDPVTHAPKGLLIQEGSANNALHSQDFTQASWVKTGLGVTADQIVAPDGTTTADLITASATTATIGVGLIIVGNPYATSFFAKKGTSDWIYMVGQNADQAKVWFNLATGVVGTVQAGAFGGRIQDVGGGWYRCTHLDVNASGAENVMAGICDADNSTAVTVGRTVYLWGAQGETNTTSLGAATSYIPTTGSIVTRAADVAVMTGTDFSTWYNAPAGTFVVEFVPMSVTQTRPVISADDGSLNEQIMLYGSNTDPKASVRDGSVQMANIDTGTIAAGTTCKLGISFALNDIAACFNGGTVGTDVVATMPSPTELRIGFDGTNYLAGWIGKVKFFNGAKTDAELQTLTETPDPYFANVVLLCGFDGADGATASTDDSDSAHTLTFNGTPGTNVQLDTGQKKFGSASLEVTGGNGRVNVGDHADWPKGSDLWTMEAFVRWDTDANIFQFLFGQWLTSGNQKALAIYRDGSGDDLELFMSSDGSTTTISITADWALSLATWYHICADFDGTKYRLYIDGAMVGSSTTTLSIFDSTAAYSIGGASGGADGFDGWIDEVRITKGVARYASDGGFTVPTAAYPRS